MSQNKPSRIYGVNINEDLDPALMRRDIRPFRVKVQNFFNKNGSTVVFMLGLFVIGNAVVPIEMFPKMFELAFLGGIGSAYYTRRQITGYPLVEPISPSDSEKAREKKGLYLLGNENNEWGNLWLTSSEIRTHILCFGTTGSGKTRFLLGILYQAMLSGSGAMYVDGKGDNTVWWLVYSFARRTDRIDDLLLINYLTGGNNYAMVGKKEAKHGKTLTEEEHLTRSDGKSLDHRISNTTNPLAQGTAEQLRSLLVGLMRESGGEGEMWKGRSSSMLKSLLETLTVLRDEGEINLDVDTVRHYMVLDRILELTNRKDLPEMAILSLKKYLLELPGFTEEDADIGVLNGECYKQHNFLTMQLTEVMSDLSGTYGHIFRAELGEVDFKDLVFNSRILFVMLPALEKDPDALAGLGKMIVAGVRSALAPALGEDVEGSKSSVTEVKPTNALEPFVLILDEYGYYAVKGFSVAAAQARSLGVSIVFAGQDYPSFTKASKEEAEAIVANTTTTICMKLEDTGETAEKIISRGAETDVQKSAGYKRKDGSASSFKDEGGVRSERQKVIDIRDLVAQGQGEGHIIRGKDVYRSALYFADPVEVDEIELNKLLMVNRPKRMVIDNFFGAYEQIDKIIKGEKKREDDLNFDEGIANLFSDYKKAVSRQCDAKAASSFAVGSIFVREFLEDEIAARRQEQELNPEPAVAEAVTSEDGTQSASKAKPGPELLDVPEKPSESTKEAPSKVTQRVVSEAEALEAVSNEDPGKSFAREAEKSSQEFTELLADTIAKVVKREGKSLSAKEEADLKPVHQISSFGSEDPMYEFDVISEKTQAYPSSEAPNKPDTSEIMSCLESVRLELRDRTKQTETES